MTVNIGSTARLLRVIAGIVLALLPFLSGLALFANPVWTWVSVIVGLVLIATGLLRFCPAYTLLGIRTNRD